MALAALPKGPARARPNGKVRYLDLLRLRSTARLLTGTLIGRLPNSMAPIALLISAQQTTGSLETGGLLTAGYLIAFALGQPMLGRLTDRVGLVPPLLGGSLLATSALSTLAFLGTAHAPAALALTIAAGGFSPPLEGGLRTLWPTVLPGQSSGHAAYLRTAYALDNGTQDAVYVVGPVLAGVLAAASTRTALLVTAAVGLGGTLSVGCSRPARRWTPAQATHHWLGPLHSAPVRALLTSFFFAGGAVGALRVCAIAQAQTSETRWLQGTLPALFSFGGLVGGLLYGARARWSGTRIQHITLLAGGSAISWLPMLAKPKPILSALLITLPGLAFTAMLCVGCLMVNTVTPRGTGTEAFGWLIAAINAGLALGTALAGLADGSYIVPFLSAAAATVVLLSARSTLLYSPNVSARCVPADTVGVLVPVAHVVGPRQGDPALGTWRRTSS
ncbi:MFS transporter [Streptomyces sp. NPDC059994]|uniref:MFS transporter n=1 Tax=Streptomyces sp. NPDC059994 TaxID=3347029 RepID=UPI0036CF2D89